MLKQRFVFIAGILVALLPYSGFPASWKTAFFVLLGLFIAFISYLFYREKKASMPKSAEYASFTDNRHSISSSGTMNDIKNPHTE